MPTTIRLLSESVVRKIAAGEVIERPASVVKELAENSIDAGAQTIHVEIAAGGRQSILVSDDGKGMTRQDAELCTERHATSKMSSPTDLFDIATLGFRGEALSSIGAVSRMTLETRCEGDEGGTRISIEGGIRSNPSTIARSKGGIAISATTCSARMRPGVSRSGTTSVPIRRADFRAML